MKRNAAFFLMFLLCGAPAACVAQSFSADVVFTGADAHNGALTGNSSSHAPSRLFVSADKMRLETGGPEGTVLLVNGADQTAFAIFPAKKEYEPLAETPSEYFRVSDPENACSAWQKASAQKVDCEKAGHESVNGRPAVKYRNKLASEVVLSAIWIDVELKFVTKWESSGAGAELRNIHEGGQSPDLFALPPDYDLTKPRKGVSKGFSQR